jgi:hypothetical protein
LSPGRSARQPTSGSGSKTIWNAPARPSFLQITSPILSRSFATTIASPSRSGYFPACGCVPVAAHASSTQVAVVFPDRLLPRAMRDLAMLVWKADWHGSGS